MMELLIKLSLDNDLYIITARNNEKNVREQLTELGVMPYITDVCVVNPFNNPDELKSKYILNQQIDVLIGDTEIDYNAAKNTNIEFYAVIHGFRSTDFWKNYNVKFFTESCL